MLTIARLTDRSGRYYLADLAAELGARGVLGSGGPGESNAPGGSNAGGPSPGRWTGTAAAGLGLGGPVEERELAAVLSGLHPHRGHPLRNRPATVGGYDLVFAAPKSVSVLFGLGGALPARAAHDAQRAAVEAAMRYVAERAVGVRSGSGEDRRAEPVRGVIAASFDHGVSRALDPHLHTHVVLANMGQGRDGRWRALDGRGLDAHARAAGALYAAHLRHALTEHTGARWIRRRSGAYELAAVDPAVLGALSARQADIRGHLHERGGANGPGGTSPAPARARSVAWAVTRDEKAGPEDRAPMVLRRLWEARVECVGWTPAELARSLSALGPPDRRATVDEHRFAAALHDGTLHGGATRRDVVAAWADALAAGAPARDVAGCVDALARWGDAVGVAEPVRRRSEVMPTPEAVRALGPRPGTPDSLAIWQSAAAALDRAHERGIDLGHPALLGACIPAPAAELARLTTEQLATRLTVERVVADARRRLGLSRSATERDAELALGRG